MRPEISLIPFGHFEKYFLDHIKVSAEQEFGHTVRLMEGWMDISGYYDPGRRQYDGNRLLKPVEQMIPARSVKGLGLFSVDLYIPILTYIFGQAYLRGRAGIVSVYRLRNELYGMKKDEDLLLERLRKVSIHELGHTFGLIHCHTPGCVMQPSTYVEDLDQKSWNFCGRCREGITGDP